MHKYIQDQIYKSRLTITYRTFIQGVPVAEELPFRLLVLGDLSGRSLDERKRLDPLAERRVRSLRKDTKFDSVMEEMAIQMPPIPAMKNRPTEFHPVVVVELIEGELEAALPEDLLRNEEKTLTLSGIGRLKMKAPMELDIEPALQQIKLTARIKVKGDDDNVPQLADSQAIKISVAGRVGGVIPAVFDTAVPLGSAGIDASWIELDQKRHVIRIRVQSPLQGKGARTIKGINGFTPDQLVASHPELYRVRLVQNFLEQLQLQLLESEPLRSGVRRLLKSHLSLYGMKRWFDSTCPMLALKPVSGDPPELFRGAYMIASPGLGTLAPTAESAEIPLAISDCMPGSLILKGKTKLRVHLQDDSSPSFSVTLTQVASTVPEGGAAATVTLAAPVSQDGVYELALDDDSLNGTPLAGYWTLKLKNTGEEPIIPVMLEAVLVEDTFVYRPTDSAPAAAGKKHERVIAVSPPLANTTIEEGLVFLDISVSADVDVTAPEFKLKLTLPPPDPEAPPLLLEIKPSEALTASTVYSFDIAAAARGTKIERKYKPLGGSWKVELETKEDVEVSALSVRVSIPSPATTFTNQALLPAGHSLVAGHLSALVERSIIEPTLFEFHDREEAFHEADRIANFFAALLVNSTKEELGKVRITGDLQQLIAAKIVEARQVVTLYLDDLYHESPRLKMLESHWRAIHDLWSRVTSDNVVIDLLDVTKDELMEDFEESQADIFSGALFQKVYIEEYDRHGGKPFGAMIGLYDFENTEDDILWLRVMSKVANAAHAPFIAATSPRFFNVKSMLDVGEIKRLETTLAHPRYGAWNELRDEDSAAYIGLTLPRFIVRKPWKVEDRSRYNRLAAYTETIDEHEDYLWTNAAMLFARNMVRSFENSGWCQHVRGPRGGGTVSGLPIHTFERSGREEIQPPVEIAVPDYRELQFANEGFIALVHRKDTADATFFSARSIKRAKVFQSELDTQNADLVCNLSYTLSITRLAHYVKRMMREYIGSTADGTYIQQVLDNWLKQYVTTVTNPDDLTLLYYPFKAATVEVTPKPGPLGWYKGVISVLPHIQFEGMDVELRLEAALGGK